MVRCGTDDAASCCASFYDRADVQYLLGDSLHPGGVDLTLRMARKLNLGAGSRVLDVACGRGTSLRVLQEAWFVSGVGLDTAAETVFGEGLAFHNGDAHNIPFPDECFDAVLCECALSTFADQQEALTEMHRVLKPGGRLAVSDMVLTGSVPSSLEDWVHVGTCLSGALDAQGYANLIASSGFTVMDRWDASEGLRELISRIKRNLLGLALAKASGTLPTDVDIDVREGRRLLREAEKAIADGIIGYGVYIAEVSG